MKEITFNCEICDINHTITKEQIEKGLFQIGCVCSRVWETPEIQEAFKNGYMKQKSYVLLPEIKRLENEIIKLERKLTLTNKKRRGLLLKLETIKKLE